MTPAFNPGTIVSARGREWIVLGGSDASALRLRPISGSEEDQTRILVDLEPPGSVREARFPWPRPEQRASHDAALLLRDALLLSLRRGAGPFRSFGHLSVEPRAYQLVPLLMALKLDPIRLLIADDVGVGKTIEAGLIARELLDRGEIDRSTVLCPPHLVEQWVTELEDRFHIHAVPVTAANARRLESETPSESIFEAYKHTVVSLDYIKSARRRDDFSRACPAFVIVDEAHTCAATGPGRHQRYELLKALAAREDRHLVLLTATPHSGDDAAFYRLLGLLKPEFGGLPEASERERERLRDRLASHFVQRRRIDIDEWRSSDPREGASLFPRRKTAELTYHLTGAWQRFFDDVLAYCAAVVARAEGDALRQRLSFWGTLALLRCAASSPVAAVLALRTRAGLEEDNEEARDALLDRLFDGGADALPDDDIEPPAGVDDPALAALIEQAERLAGTSGDPKLDALSKHLGQLIKAGFNPVVFCRYIATAHYLGRHLGAALAGARVSVVTGELTSEERREKVETLRDADTRVLVATDCLSEGINLQDLFDAVVHYDLSWNPTRHEQREGRVDRFGQPSPEVRATLMYGANNPVDGAVLEVIIRKAAKIREELGVPVPVPDEGRALTTALLQAVLLRQRGSTVQQTLFGVLRPEKDLEIAWKDAEEKARGFRRTVFAQRRLQPEDVLPEWRRTLAAIGDTEDVRRLVERALARLGAGLEVARPGFRAPLAALPEDVRERLDAEGLSGTLRLDFRYPAPPPCLSVQRSHPLVSVLAETLLERTLAGGPEGLADPGSLGRVGCWTSAAVQSRTLVALVRLRHQLVSRRGPLSREILVEEAGALAWSGSSPTPTAEGDEALALLKPSPAADPPEHVRIREALRGLEQLSARAAELDAYAARRAETLLADHERVRASARGGAGHAVSALSAPDVIALFVLLPRVD